MQNRAAGVHGTVLAEFVYAGALWLLLDVGRLAAERAALAWFKRPSRELYCGTLVVVGLGSIGVGVTRIGRAFGMTVVGLTRDRAPRPDAGWQSKMVAVPQRGMGTSVKRTRKPDLIAAKKLNDGEIKEDDGLRPAHLRPRGRRS